MFLKWFWFTNHKFQNDFDFKSPNLFRWFDFDFKIINIWWFCISLTAMQPPKTLSTLKRNAEGKFKDQKFESNNTKRSIKLIWSCLFDWDKYSLVPKKELPSALQFHHTKHKSPPGLCLWHQSSTSLLYLNQKKL